MKDDDLLHRELYTLREAARTLHLSPSKLRYWLDGAERHGVVYEPVIRPEPTGCDIVTWGELVEAACLKEYRTRTSLQRLRPAIVELRERFQLLYPLANLRPFLVSQELVMEVQSEVDLPPSLHLIERLADGQLGFSATYDLFRTKVEFADSGHQPALRMRPHGVDHRVVIDPTRSFGAATVDGIRTQVLAELYGAGEEFAVIAEQFDLSDASLRDALAYEDDALVVAAP